MGSRVCFSQRRFRAWITLPTTHMPPSPIFTGTSSWADRRLLGAGLRVLSLCLCVGHLGLGVRIVSSWCLVCVSWTVFLELMKALENLSSVRQGSTFCSLSPGTQSSVFMSWKSGIIKNCFFRSSRLNFGSFTPLTVVRKVEWLFLNQHWLVVKTFSWLACYDCCFILDCPRALEFGGMWWVTSFLLP